MLQHDNEGFYFDRLRINSAEEKHTLWKKLPIAELRNESRNFSITNPHHSLTGYKSRIEVIAPTQRFLEILLEHESLLLRDYLFTYVEIAHDEFSQSASAAESEANMFMNGLRKKYSFGYIYKDEDEQGNKRFKTRKEVLKDRSRGLFASRTFYAVFEEKKDKQIRLNYVVYARFSKINWKPCLHKEWRIKGSANMKKRTRIEKISDLLHFDFKTFFVEMSDRYIVHEELNNEAIGMWLLDFDGRRNLTEEQRSKAGLRAIMFRRVYGIMTYSDLRRFFNDERKRIEGQRGARSEWDTRIMSLKNYQRFKRGVL